MLLIHPSRLHYLHSTIYSTKTRVITVELHWFTLTLRTVRSPPYLSLCPQLYQTQTECKDVGSRFARRLIAMSTLVNKWVQTSTIKPIPGAFQMYIPLVKIDRNFCSQYTTFSWNAASSQKTMTTAWTSYCVSCLS